MWNKILLIGLGGGLGSICRYGVANAAYQVMGRNFPYGTLVVNIVGCFIMGLLFILLLERVDSMGGLLRALLLVGFLGGFTTFSSFSIETFNLLENGEVAKVFMNIGLSIIVCLLATWLGVVIGRQL